MSYLSGTVGFLCVMVFMMIMMEIIIVKFIKDNEDGGYDRL